MALRADWLRVVYRYRKLRVLPDDLTSAEQRELYAGLCEVLVWLWKNLTPTLTGYISCDEAHNLLRQKDFLQRVERLITGGRKHGVECCRLSQRPQFLHTMVISQGDRRAYFAISDDDDLAKINRVASLPARRLRDLPARRCIVGTRIAVSGRRFTRAVSVGSGRTSVVTTGVWTRTCRCNRPSPGIFHILYLVINQSLQR